MLSDRSAAQGVGGVVYGLIKIVEKMMKSKDGADPQP
jgi:hypothetical protein